MVTVNMKNLTPMVAGRLRKALDVVYKFEDRTRTLGEQLDQWTSVEKSNGDGMVDWNRVKYNRMDDAEQKAYEAGLREKRYYYLNGLRVPKIVYDAVEGDTRDV